MFLAAVIFPVAVLHPWHLIILRQKSSKTQQRNNIKMPLVFLLPKAMFRCSMPEQTINCTTKGTNEIWFPMDLWQDVTLVPETWGVSLSANILNPDEDFISASLWNGIMNFEMTYIKKKKKKEVLKITEELLLKFWPCLNRYQDLYLL